MRPRQWVKNVLVLVAPAAAGVVTHGTVLAHCAVAFVAFCLTASGVYLLNDVRDVHADRSHPHKRHRAIAAGQLAPAAAVTAGAVLIVLGLGATQIDHPNWALGVIVGLYAANSLAYVAGLKRVAVFELASVAAGFFLRSVAGAAASHLFVSTWFLVVVSFGALFLVVGKRTAEKHRLGEGAMAHRAVLAEYSEQFLTSALTMTATVVVSGYCLWAFDTSRTGLSSIDHNVTAIRLTVLPVVLAILHIMRLLEGGGGGAPEDLVLEDRTVQALGLVWAVLMAIGIYG
jgi:decaprenyl-phosphate phosphoribosyltransferase